MPPGSQPWGAISYCNSAARTRDQQTTGKFCGNAWRQRPQATGEQGHVHNVWPSHRASRR